MSDVERRQVQQRAFGVAACAAVFAAGGPLISYSADQHKEGEEYLANVGKLSVELADGTNADEVVGVPSLGASIVPVSYELARDVVESRDKDYPVVRNLFENASFTARDLQSADAARSELDCLAEAIYYEARSESAGGQMAVAEVVLNRVKDGRFPNTVCEVVYQGQYRTTGCQFTFTCDGSKRRAPRGRAWERSRAVALHVSLGLGRTRTNNATHYHTYYVDPYWSAGLVETKVIGSHIFYRFPRTQNEWDTTRIAMQTRDQHRRVLEAIEASADTDMSKDNVMIEVSADTAVAVKPESRAL